MVFLLFYKTALFSSTCSSTCSPTSSPTIAVPRNVPQPFTIGALECEGLEAPWLENRPPLFNTAPPSMGCTCCVPSRHKLSLSEPKLASWSTISMSRSEKRYGYTLAHTMLFVRFGLSSVGIGGSEGGVSKGDGPTMQLSHHPHTFETSNQVIWSPACRCLLIIEPLMFLIEPPDNNSLILVMKRHSVPDS